LIFILEYALAKLWLSWGIKPKAMLGYSLGEYVAACLANVISLPDLLPIVALGGRLLAQLPPLKFLNIAESEEKLKPLLVDKEISLIAVNGPSLCLIGGTAKAIATLSQRLKCENITTDYLNVGIASHTKWVNSFLEDYVEFGKRIPLQEPTIPYLSGLTGTWVSADDTSCARYWGKVMNQTVRFADAISDLLQDPNQILLELGPGTTLTTLVNRHPHKPEQTNVLNSLYLTANHTRSDTKLALTSLGQLWLAGTEVHWRAFYAGQRRYQVSLPYPLFETEFAAF
jgi:acyl transferase domain-containing protein